jgi:D-cysteine desulfhydrase family pyridoxal phosphate-dependent enzyme
MTTTGQPLRDAILERIAALPRCELGATLPTPLGRLSSLSQIAGVDLLIKRDDMTGVGTGGNKVRKLEFLLAQAQAEGCDWIVTTGGAQSNHAQLTAACAARLGIGCSVVLRTRGGDSVPRGNLLLEDVMGTEVQLLETEEYFAHIGEHLEATAERKRAEGRRPLIIPLGGATPLGSVGYVLCCAELAAQADAMGISIGTIVTAVGSCGTAAGLVVGAEVFLPGTKLVGVSVAPPAADATVTVERLAEETRQLLGIDGPATHNLEVFDSYIGEGYALASPGGSEAVRTVARSEGLFLDPVYTGKAMDGFLDLSRQGRFAKDETVVFLHTGGLAAIFAVSLIPGEQTAS